MKKNYGNGWLRGGEVSAYDLAITLDRLYNDPVYYRHLLQVGSQTATVDAFQKSGVTQQWNQLFRSLMQQKTLCK